jgi:tRNA-splicing ligase RtcB (3'-phosphate/5'-hydroxy nucleic acid ligase)
MQNIIEMGAGFPLIKIWATDLEEGALIQAKNMARMPFVWGHIAIMADAHQGYGVPIGGVIALQEHIIPNAVGVDIGCGVQAVEFPYNGEVSEAQFKEILGQIREAVPVGFNWHKTPQYADMMPEIINNTHVISNEYEKAQCQLGTLGGGNHFIEIQRDTAVGNIWAMIHSGSRNLGKQVADFHHEVALSKMENLKQQLPDKNLAYLNITSPAGKAYINDMTYCLTFARMNRTLMINRVVDIIQRVLGCGDTRFRYDIHHNYAAIEEHFGLSVVVHRKGATSARMGQTGIIPGSQGTASYIVEGLGNFDSFMSCSHGAGRKMSRSKAKKELNLEEEIARMNERGIVHNIRTVKDLDEAASAYKDIDEVMANQTDLIRPTTHLLPLAVIKG